jgi:hypothetical protein
MGMTAQKQCGLTQRSVFPSSLGAIDSSSFGCVTALKYDRPLGTPSYLLKSKAFHAPIAAIPVHSQVTGIMLARSARLPNCIIRTSQYAEILPANFVTFRCQPLSQRALRALYNILRHIST